MFDEEDAQTLVKLGLNSSQAKIYLTLVSLGTANAKQIAQTANIDHGEVYRQLEVLQEKTLVEKILKVPTDYKPIALNEALEILIQRKNKETVEVQQKAQALLKKGGQMEPLKEEGQKISILPRNDYRIRYSERALENSQKEWLWYTPIERIPISIDNYYETMKRALDRGVCWRAIAEISKPPSEHTITFIQKFKDENSKFEIRYSKTNLFITFALYDNRDLSVSTEKMTGLANSPLLNTNNEQIISVFKEYFELKWKAAKVEIPKNLWCQRAPLLT